LADQHVEKTQNCKINRNGILKVDLEQQAPEFVLLFVSAFIEDCSFIKELVPPKPVQKRRLAKMRFTSTVLVLVGALLSIAKADFSQYVAELPACGVSIQPRT